MQTRRRWWMLLILVGLGATPALRADDAVLEGDLKELQGTWTADLMGSPSTWTIKGDELTIKGNVRTYIMKMKLDEKAEPHKALDLEIKEGPEDAFGKTSLAVYKIDDKNKWTICFRGMGERPQKFEQVGFEQWVIELNRKTD